MADVVTDTHALIWYLQDDVRLGRQARQAFEACERGECVIYVPTICLVEIVYLQEKGVIPANMKMQFDAVLRSGHGLLAADLTDEVVNALAHIPRAVVPDMPDRIIAATALQLGLPLLSHDHKIQAAPITVLW
jgi:PIN domain nuclease of toxin-antitoxin system